MAPPAESSAPNWSLISTRQQPQGRVAVRKKAVTVTIIHHNSDVQLASFEPDLDFELEVLGLVDITSYELVDPSGKPVYFADKGAARWLADLDEDNVRSLLGGMIGQARDLAKWIWEVPVDDRSLGQEARLWLESDGDGSILYLLPDFTLS
jgi:hypothetical protein